MSAPICQFLAHQIPRSTLKSNCVALHSSRLLQTPQRCHRLQTIGRRRFGGSARLAVVKPYLLADIGEGITECQIIQWFVQPGARVAQFDKICEVQSDKAAVEITSRFDGIIKKLHYEADDMATVGKPLVDIDIQSEISPEDEALTKPETDEGESARPTSDSQKSTTPAHAPTPRSPDSGGQHQKSNGRTPSAATPPDSRRSLATPAVRHMMKELNLRIEDIDGTGRDGRVLKEDVQRFAATQSESTDSAAIARPSEPLSEDKEVQFTPVQRKMFETMTKSLSIPHFLYTDTVDFTSLSTVRRALNSHSSTSSDPQQPKLSALPFILKAVSLAFSAFPSVNAQLDTSSNSGKPVFTQKASHNFGVAIDTPQGLVVPVIRNVQSLDITSLAAEIQRLSQLARNNKLSASDFSGATFTISNIGSLGGTAVAPVIVSPQVAILGVGRARAVPAFDANGAVVRREECVFSWSADHRVLDGATVAKAAELVRGYLEGTERMLVKLR